MRHYGVEAKAKAVLMRMDWAAVTIEHLRHELEKDIGKQGVPLRESRCAVLDLFTTVLKEWWLPGTDDVFIPESVD